MIGRRLALAGIVSLGLVLLGGGLASGYHSYLLTVQQLMAAAFPVPPEVIDEVHTEHRAVRQRNEGGELSDDVARGRVPGVDHALVDSLLDLEGRDNGARGQQLQLQPPT